MLIALLFVLGRGRLVSADSPPNLTSDIEWDENPGLPGNQQTYSGVAAIAAAYDNARRQEEIQLGLAPNTLGNLSLPTQAVWNGMSLNDRGVHILNQERVARGGAQPGVLGLPYAGQQVNIVAIAQYYADYLVANNAFSHTADGYTPFQRIDNDPALAACHEFLSRAENLASFFTSGTSVPLPLERAIYAWMYDDASSLWGHREALLLQDVDINMTPGTGFNNNVGSILDEGFIGFGIQSAVGYDPFNLGINFGLVVVFNEFDPISTGSCPWDVTPTPTATPVTPTATPIPPTATPIPPTATPIPPTPTPSPTATPAPGTSLFFNYCAFGQDDGGDALRVEEFGNVNCSVGGTGKAELKKDSSVDGDVDSVEKEVIIDERVFVGGSIEATKKTEIGEDAIVAGSVVARDEIKLDKFATVNGDATSADKISLNTGAVINGTITEYATIPAATPITIDGFTVVYGSADVDVEEGAPVTLPPGAYKKLVVEENAVLTLMAGAYSFEEFKVEKDGIVNLSLGGSTVVVKVKKNVELQDRAQMVLLSGSAEDVLFLVAEGNVKLKKEGAYIGTFIAPEGHIDLEDDATLTGGLYGEKVHIKKQATLTGAPAVALYLSIFP